MFAKAILFTCALAVKITHGDDVAALTDEEILGLEAGVTAFLAKAKVDELSITDDAVVDSKWEKLFGKIDESGNGKVTKDEIVAYLIEHPEHIPKEPESEESKAESSEPEEPESESEESEAEEIVA